MFFPTFDTSLWNNFPCTQLWKLTLFAFTSEENDCHCLSFRIFVNWTGLLQKGNAWIPQFEISRFYQFRVSCKFQIISIYSYFHSKNIQQSIPADYVFLFTWQNCPCMFMMALQTAGKIWMIWRKGFWLKHRSEPKNHVWNILKTNWKTRHFLKHVCWGLHVTTTSAPKIKACRDQKQAGDVYKSNFWSFCLNFGGLHLHYIFERSW